MQTVSNQNPNQNIHYDFVYINPGLENILQALAELKNRQKVLLVFENDLERNDRFFITRTFPFHLFEIPVLMQQFRILESVIKLIPHLFQSHKVLYVNQNQTSKFTATLADYKYKNTYQKKLEIFTPAQLEQLSFLRNIFKKSIYFHEHKLNVSRLFIELLKYFYAEGGTVKVNLPVNIEKNKLIFLQTKEIATGNNIYVCTIEKNTSYLLPAGMPHGFSMVYKDSKPAFRFTGQQKGTLAVPINTVSEKVSRQTFLTFAKALFTTKIDRIIATEKVEEPSPEIQKKLVEQIQHPLDCAFENTGFNDLNERCLEKFDLAKQTGILYADFKIIFHRYGNTVDQMTEEAYILMNEFRDPEKIWNLVEENVQKKYEWGI